MSVQTNTYAIIGAMIPYKAAGGDNYERLEPYFDSAFDGIHHHDGLCVISDGMNGDYAVVGKVLAKSDEFGHLPKPVVFEPITNPEMVELKGKIEALFPDQPIEIRAITLTHYR